MKTILEKCTREELIQRIGAISDTSTAQWGKMNAYQMVKHCRLWEEMITGTLPCKRVFIGRLFGRLALRATLKNDRPMGKHAPTSRELIVTETLGDIEVEKVKWIALMRGHENFSNHHFIHPFFGAMTIEQIGYHAYKHTDHHLRQFNG